MLELTQLRHVHDPLIVSEGLGVKISHQRVRAGNPPSSGDSVGHIDELGGEKLIELLEEGSLQQFGMNFSDSIDLMRANDTQISHYDPFGYGLLNQRKSIELVPVVGVFFADLVQPEEVNDVDQLQMARKELAQ